MPWFVIYPGKDAALLEGTKPAKPVNNEPDITHLITNQSQQPFCIKYLSHAVLLEAADF